MKWFLNLKISVKILAGFLIIALFAGVVGFVGIKNIAKVNNAADDMYNVNLMSISKLSKIQKSLLLIRSNVLLMAYEGDITKTKDRVEQVKKWAEDNTKVLDEYGKSKLSDTERSLFKQLNEDLVPYRTIRAQFLELVENNKYDEARALIPEFAKAREKVDSGLEKLIEANKSLADKADKENEKIYKNITVLMISIIFAAVLLAVLVGFFIALSISKPVKRLTEIADKLAVGDINVQVEANTKDEVGLLMHAFSKMVASIRDQALVAEKMAAGDLTVQVDVRSENDILGKNLREMVIRNNDILLNINGAADQVAAGAKQVSDSSQGLSQGTTEQASSIEEITASITQVAAQTKQNAVNASQANELAITAKDAAVSGNSQMKGMLKAMEEINEASGSISKIIKVIDEIAFQTNILALNAAVEAARAGQHGKGFAVVAEEVRNLAARSANAAKETTALIEGSVKKVEMGTTIANGTAQALAEIVDGASRAAELVAEIACASNEQASGIAQVNQAINQVSQVTQMNTATAEESAAASEELASQAELLKNLVGQFRLKRNPLGYSSTDSINPEIMRAIEQMMAAKGGIEPHRRAVTQAEAASTSEPRIRIALDDKEFGKY